MKKYLLFFCLIANIGLCYSQEEASDFTGKDLRERQHAPQSDRFNFVPNEVLVKFKDDVIVSSGTNLKSAGISSVDQVLKANGVALLEKLFPAEKKLKSAQILKDPTGRDMKIPSLHNIYRITVPQLKSTGSTPADIFKFMEELKALPEVEYAEPNYVFTIGDFTPTGREMTMLEAMEQTVNSELSKTAIGLVPNDPLYNSQWGIPATKIDVVWNTTTGDATSVIAILDTGVDWQHPDLAANIWENTQEIPANGIDDDGNGLIDDIRGWDYINNDNNPTDDNSHGTHVAGIAAAVGNNGIGIAGANWKAKIIPIKVFQSSGKGDAATIAKGITYAASKGATVINMSFGSYSESLTMKNALARAYATAVLVAAAGNDALCIGPGLCPDRQLGAPMYPGAYSFVLGVEANKQIPDLDGIRAGFSNYDQDGPVFSQYIELLNYELVAPGTGILSCVPGGNYREYNGTSMAAPLVAGAVSLYRKQKPGESQEMLFGNFINSLGQHIDIEKAINIIPEPKLDIVSYTVTDTIDGDRDGRPDAGETIELKIKVRNTWGQANDVKVGLEFGEFEDKTTATILTSEATIGTVSAYAIKENLVSLKLKLATNINDGRNIVLKLKTWYGDHIGEISQTITIDVENGEELFGVMDTVLILTSNKLWLVNSSFKVGQNGTLIIKPGTHLNINTPIVNRGKIYGNGKSDSLIIITGLGSIQDEYIKGKMNFKYTTFSGMNDAFVGDSLTFTYCIFEGLEINPFFAQKYSGSIFHSRNIRMEDNIFRNSKFAMLILGDSPYHEFQRNNIEDCMQYITNLTSNLTSPIKGSNNNFVNIQNYYYQDSEYSGPLANLFKATEQSESNNNFISIGKKEYFFKANGTADILSLNNNYWGTLNMEKIKSMNYDFWKEPSLPVLNYSPIRITPSKFAHGIVWKVVVNDKDAQDEYDLMDPLGVGKQKFEIYFNHPLDVKYPPIVSMGVRYPYSQTALAEDGSWSADSTIYTVHGTVGLSTGDGINTIRVIGAKDMDHFEIPIEDRRFRVVVNAAGSLSAGFEATPGMGSVVLKWEAPDASVSDLMGYNLYRYSYLNDSVTTDTVSVNSKLIAEPEFTDFDVLPATKYFYAYKTVRTNLTESNYSKVVAATPLTSSKGDANGDLNVNALDISSVVSYLLNNKPQPFIFEAADINNDQSINVLDVVSLANVIYKPIISDPTATDKLMNLYLNDDILYIDAPKAVAAIQFDFSGILSMDEIQKLPALDGFETAYSKDGDSFRFIAYSLSGKNIPAGYYVPLLKIKKGSGLMSSLFSDEGGNQIKTKSIPTGIWNFRDNLDHKTAELGQNYPNPLSKTTTIPIKIYEPVDEAVIRIVNTQGQEIYVIRLNNPELGEHLINWNTGNNKGLIAYMLVISRGNQQFLFDVKKMIVY